VAEKNPVGLLLFQWPLLLLCETLEVSTAGYYALRERLTSAWEQRRDALLVEIRAIHAEVKACCGSQRIHAEQAARGQPCIVNTVARPMEECGIAAKAARKFGCNIDLNPDQPVADNLGSTGSSTPRPRKRPGWRT